MGGVSGFSLVSLREERLRLVVRTSQTPVLDVCEFDMDIRQRVLSRVTLVAAGGWARLERQTNTHLCVFLETLLVLSSIVAFDGGGSGVK